MLCIMLLYSQYLQFRTMGVEVRVVVWYLCCGSLTSEKRTTYKLTTYREDNF